jgi:MerR family transcriptional regulator, repressor of the yfmOP operon
MSAVASEPRPLRIGEVAREVGTTPRTIRYYEEIGLLPGTAGRPSGGHRNYTAADVDRLRELIRLRDLLGVSLEELRELVEAEEARAVLRREFQASDDPRRRAEILHQALGHIDRQLELVRRRKGELERLEGELSARRRRVKRRLADGPGPKAG